MSKTRKPLFSRPFLSALMIIIPAMVLLLNLTAQDKEYPAPEIRTWTTESGVPVIWLNQYEWTSHDGLQMRILFNHGYSNDDKLSLTESTFDLLLRDTLPLSTTQINERLTPLAAKVNYKLQSNKSELAITIDNRHQLLQPSLDFLMEWLPAPTFKSRTFANWKNTHQEQSLKKAQLISAIYGDSVNDTAFYEPIQLDDIRNSYQQLTQQVNSIIIVGALNKVEDMQRFTNNISANFNAVNNTPSKTANAEPSLQKAEGESLIESYGGLAIAPLTQPKEWFSLQFWATHFLQAVNDENPAHHVELHIEAAQPSPWIWWRIMHAPNVLQSENSEKDSSTEQYYSRPLLQQLTVDEDEFDDTLEIFQQRTLLQATRTEWWANIASQVVQSDTEQLQNWINQYGLELSEFSYDIYQQQRNSLLQIDQLHEVQVHQ